MMVKKGIRGFTVLTALMAISIVCGCQWKSGLPSAAGEGIPSASVADSRKARAAPQHRARRDTIFPGRCIRIFPFPRMRR